MQTYARMFAMRSKILPANRDYAEYYLRYTWGVSVELAKAFDSPATTIPEYALDKFKEYVQHEEDRIRKNLAAVKYDIDALETVYAIIGPGRIEKVRNRPAHDPGICTDNLMHSTFWHSYVSCLGGI